MVLIAGSLCYPTASSVEDVLCEALSKVFESLKTKHYLALSSFKTVHHFQT